MASGAMIWCSSIMDMLFVSVQKILIAKSSVTSWAQRSDIHNMVFIDMIICLLFRLEFNATLVAIINLAVHYCYVVTFFPFSLKF